MNKIENGEVIQMTVEEIDAHNALQDSLKLNELTTAQRATRIARTGLLAASDWTQASDSPLTTAQKALWTAYRQELRDITSQETFSTTGEVEFPTKPE